MAKAGFLEKSLAASEGRRRVNAELEATRAERVRALGILRLVQPLGRWADAGHLISSGVTVEQARTWLAIPAEDLAPVPKRSAEDGLLPAVKGSADDLFKIVRQAKS